MDVASWINLALLQLSILFPQELFQGLETGDGVAIETPDSSTDLWGTPLFSSFVQRTKCCENLAFRCCSLWAGCYPVHSWLSRGQTGSCLQVRPEPRDWEITSRYTAMQLLCVLYLRTVHS